MQKLVFGIIIGSLCNLDNSLVANIMISRPIVLAPILGLIFSEIKLGFEIGFLIEFLFADLLYIGNVVPINLSLFITLFFGINHKISFSSDALNMLNIFVSLLITYLFTNVEIGMRIINSNFANKIEKLIINKNVNFLNFGIFGSISFFFILNIILLFLGIFIGSEFIKIFYIELPYKIILALDTLYDFLPILSFIVILNTFLSGD